MDKKTSNKLTNLKKYNFSPKSILDLGAYHGSWSLSALEIFPEANYMLIEPISYIQLENICKINPNFKYKNVLLFDDEREVDWYERRNTGDSIFKELTGHFENCIPVKKQTINLDKLFVNDKFDLIKIDCQGSEISILKGGLNLIKNTEFIILEIPFCGQWNYKVPNFLEHIKFMDEKNFIPFDILEEHYLDSVLIQVDFIFINKNSDILNAIQNNIKSNK